MLKTFCYRLYPSKVQERKLEATRETCRRWYNDLLAERKTAYEERKETIGKYEQLRRVKDHKASNPWAADVHSHVLQVVVADLDNAFQAFFRRVKSGQKAGYPRFRGRNRFDSFGFKEYGNGFKIDGRRLRVSGIGRIAVRWHRPLEGTIKTLRLIKKASGWYACFSVEYTPQPLAPTGRDVGVDVGIASLITTSDGASVPPQHWYKREQRKLRVLQRRVARRTKGGKNRRKAVVQLQRQHERIANQRKDFLNKLANALIQQYDRIAVENLRITNMVNNRHLAKSILDAGWGYFVARLHAKAAEAARVVVEVDPAYTSKTCSGCGHVFENLTLKDRWIVCGCGLSLDRDHNAAINILKRGGQLRWGISTPLGVLPQEAAGL
ncbi:RNA-guided endonuclease InsQ/TnpB family protein [Kallotenue papyrolyticum]|uniref:RNA-guided endonuclease InsQ/TnpB family protein n=1 Tax=Kallotenue papyrolyticum TaxID=1325125 RepID=UPI0004785DBD|nr:RNA-guided endonuclease TnpB family protein [Kallotenue papyrolyticum]